jgi:hypothetical protein
MTSSAKYKNSEAGTRLSKRALLALLTTAAVLAVAGVLFIFDPAQGGFYPSCMFHNLTGLNCPGCGSLRALHHLTHGEILVAFRSNPLLMTLLPLFAFIGVRWLQHGRGPFENDSIFLRPATAWTLLAATLVFTVLRNLPGPAFAWMSP